MRYKGMPVTDEMVDKILSGRRDTRPPAHNTFPVDSHSFQRRITKLRRRDEFVKIRDIIIRYERKKAMKLLLADLGPHYLDNLRRECLGLPLMKVA